MSKKEKVLQKENVVQAIIVADTFDDEFVPICNTIPHVNHPYRFHKHDANS